MEEKIRELLENYHLEIKRLYRGRGAWFCETEEGLKMFRVYDGSPLRLQWEGMVKACLRERGYVYIDSFVANKEGNYLTTDEDGQGYVLTDWYGGRECGTRDREEILRATAHMAWMHRGMQAVSRESGLAQVYCQGNVMEEMDRRQRELRRIRNYILKKKQKNAFDRRFMEVYPEFDAAGESALRWMAEGDYPSLFEEACREQKLCHGDYTQHNVLVSGENLALVRFDRMHLELQIYDLYVFMRKMLEKNRWNTGLGMAMLKTYDEVLPFSRNQLVCLYGMMIFPEKFWKIANRYQNTRKSWMSAQNMDKLNKLIRERSERQNFLAKMEEYWKRIQ